MRKISSLGSFPTMIVWVTLCYIKWLCWLKTWTVGTNMIKHVELNRCHGKGCDWTKRAKHSLEEPFMTPKMWKKMHRVTVKPFILFLESQGSNFSISEQSRATLKLEASNFNTWEFGTFWNIQKWPLKGQIWDKLKGQILAFQNSQNPPSKIL